MNYLYVLLYVKVSLFLRLRLLAASGAVSPVWNLPLRILLMFRGRSTVSIVFLNLLSAVVFMLMKPLVK